ncbi:GntR family transcriptional regulator [Aerococcus kribbianus]|uniref:GntR family transcriptional regulator n=1 Tax=Aerococcus kribbianus TaxID=2999064 RepID=A0A9X3JFW5_9LACT|nr:MULTISPECIES: GntR family transcriptional regulator [unclassified Aerococcus]MCZ0717472.1 GntR family transcriptional regulator [Aerococcus sp. YH-aer221]MCZ0725760.1 GntR family transcriptional regulator [Aerococcus sp. YH-aer222]
MSKDKSYAELAYDYLKDQIDSNMLLADTHLKEVEIAEQLGMSRTPVRKAMAQLEVEGYIRIEPYKGAVVAKSSLNSRAIVERLQFIELLVMNLFQQMENKAITLDRDILNDFQDRILNALTEEDYTEYFKVEYDFYAYLATFYANSYFRQVTLNTIHPLHEIYHKEMLENRTTLEREAHDMREIYPNLIKALIEGDYVVARKQTRIWVNQLILYQINK